MIVENNETQIKPPQIESIRQVVAHTVSFADLERQQIDELAQQNIVAIQKEKCCLTSCLSHIFCCCGSSE